MASTWVTVAWGCQSLVDNTSMVFGLGNFIGYECAPHLNRGSDSRWTLHSSGSGIDVGVMKVANVFVRKWRGGYLPVRS